MPSGADSFAVPVHGQGGPCRARGANASYLRRCAPARRDRNDHSVGPLRAPTFLYGAPRVSRGITHSAAGVSSRGRIPGPARPGAAGSTFRQPWKECKHGNEEKSEKSCEEKDRQEGQEEEGRKTQSGKQEENSEEKGGLTQDEAGKEKGGPQGRQEKSCEETRQEEGGAGSGGQTGGEIRAIGTDGSTCCSVGRGGAGGENRPQSRCCLAVPNRVTTLGGSRIVCGRALCRQSPNRRHSALQLLVPRFSPRGRRHFSSRLATAPGCISPKIFLLCDAPSAHRQVSDSALVFHCLTGLNSFIRLHFSVISQRLNQPIAQPDNTSLAPRIGGVLATASESEPQRFGKPGTTASSRTGFSRG